MPLIHPPPTRDPPATLAHLTDSPRNPRTIKPRALAGLGVSLKTFGDLSGITYNFTTGNLVAGHQRRKALADADLGSTPIDWGDWYDTPNGPERYGVAMTPSGAFKIRGVAWSPEMESAANVAANNPHIAGEFTEDLDAMLAEIEADDAGLYEALRLDDLRAVEPERSDTDIPPSEFLIVVTCHDEAEQRDVWEDLKRRGLECKLIG